LGDKSSIEWTDASWNPTTGCTKVSPGCQNCYAERLAGRLKLMGNPKYKRGFDFTLQPTALDLPLKWSKPRKIFVNSMSDLFHEEMPDEYLDQCFEVMEKADWHVYQILTKRPERLARYAKRHGKFAPHIWLGTSVEMALYKPRIGLLRQADVPIRFISFEPLIGPIGQVDLKGVSWAIVGGESGPKHRAIKIEWVRDLRDQCIKQNVAFFFKQWGGHTPKSGGRLLDGLEWNEYPVYVPEHSGRPVVVPMRIQSRKATR
jgi:protein gp37